MGRYVIVNFLFPFLGEKVLFFIAFIFYILGIALGMLFTQEYTLIPSLNEEQRSFLATLIFILETNLIIASVISILGFLTGGLLSIMVLFFNGLKIGEILNVR